MPTRLVRLALVLCVEVVLIVLLFVIVGTVVIPRIEPPIGQPTATVDPG